MLNNVQCLFYLLCVYSLLLLHGKMFEVCFSALSQATGSLTLCPPHSPPDLEPLSSSCYPVLYGAGRAGAENAREEAEDRWGESTTILEPGSGTLRVFSEL